MQTRTKNRTRTTTTATATLTVTSKEQRFKKHHNNSTIPLFGTFFAVTQHMKLSNVTFYRRQDELFILLMKMDLLGLENWSPAN